MANYKKKEYYIFKINFGLFCFLKSDLAHLYFFASKSLNINN